MIQPDCQTYSQSYTLRRNHLCVYTSLIIFYDYSITILIHKTSKKSAKIVRALSDVLELHILSKQQVQFIGYHKCQCNVSFK